MIDRMTGAVLEVDGGRVVLDVGGVGYDLAVPLGAVDRLKPGAPATLFVHAVYAADRQELFGFPTRRERDGFRQVIGVAGVGPRTALAVLSALTLDDLRSAILRDDQKALLKVSGVGKKLAGRLVLELKDKVLLWTAGGGEGAGGPGSGDDERAVAALTGLGYRPAQAARAVELARRRLGEGAPLDELVRAALGEALSSP